MKITLQRAALWMHAAFILTLGACALVYGAVDGYKTQIAFEAHMKELDKMSLADLGKVVTRRA